MALISVSGACSRAGKTALAVSVLEALPRGRAAAVKFTTTEDVFKRCPRGAPCVVCDIDVPFRIVDDPAVLAEPGTDTERLARAGATRVVWAISRWSAIAEAWSAVFRRIAGSSLVVMEGSTIVEHARPDLNLFVVHPHLPPDRWKPTSGALLAQADAVIVNRPRPDTRPPAPAVLDEIRRFRPDRPPLVADVTEPVHLWWPELAPRVRAWTAAVGA